MSNPHDVERAAKAVLASMTGTGFAYVSVPREKLADLSAAVFGEDDHGTKMLRQPATLRRLGNGAITDADTSEEAWNRL